jgi:hypothetical protein
MDHSGRKGNGCGHGVGAALAIAGQLLLSRMMGARLVGSVATRFTASMDVISAACGMVSG